MRTTDRQDWPAGVRTGGRDRAQRPSGLVAGPALALGLTLGLTLALVPRPSRAADPREAERARGIARTVTQEATAAFDRREYGKAQQLLEAGYRIFPSEKIQYSLGRVYEAQQNPVAAMVAYQRFLRLVPATERLPSQTDDVTEAIKRLRGELGRVTVLTQGGGARSVEVVVDDSPAQAVTVPGGEVWVTPGSHRIQLDGMPEVVTVTAAASTSVYAPPPSPARASVPAVRLRPAINVAKWVLGGLGLTALGVGGTLWAVDGYARCPDLTLAVPCGEPLGTQVPGIALVAAGGAMLTASFVLFGLDARQRAAHRRARTEARAAQAAPDEAVPAAAAN